MIGLAADLIGGLLGIGGSIVMIPAMTELLGPQQHLYQAAALIVTFFVAVPSLIQHVRARAVCGSIVRRLVVPAACAAVGGVVLSELPVFRGNGALYLTGFFGLFLFYVAAQDTLRLAVNAPEPSEGPQAPGQGMSSRTSLLVSLPTGLVSGLLGVGGGVLAVPLQRRILGLPTRTAIANSSAMIVVLSLVGASFKHYGLIVNHPEYLWYDPARLAILLIPMAIVGAAIGARMTHVLPIRLVRGAFVVLLVVAGARMVYRAMEVSLG